MNTLVRQKGVALLVAMMLLLTGTALYLTSEHRRKFGGNDETLHSLLAAKQSLLAYAVNYADNYGHKTRGGTGRLPCPALQRFSSPAMRCDPNTIGYLPTVWERNGRLMEIDYLERFLDRDIWYSVSADHRYNPAFNTLNSEKGPGLFSVDGLQDVIAVLIAPGDSNNTQNRGSVAGQAIGSVVSEYLEGENADLDAEFTLTEANDLLVPIRRSELIPLIERRVLGFAKQWLIEYKSMYGFYPYAASLAGSGECEAALMRGLLAIEAGNCAEPPLAGIEFSNLPIDRTLRQTWFYRYGWPSFIYYAVDETCAPANGAVDCDGVNDPQRLLTVNGKQVEVVLISTGEAIETAAAGGLQVRTEPALANYLDTVALLSATTDYSVPLLSGSSNDQLVFIE